MCACSGATLRPQRPVPGAARLAVSLGSLHLLANGFLSELLRQLRFELRRQYGQQIGIVGYEGPFNVGLIKHKHILPGSELHGALKVLLVHLAVRLSSLQFDALGIDKTPGASPTDPHDPGKANIDQERGLDLVRQKPEELNRTFVPAFGNAYLLRAGQLFVACHSLQSIPKRPRIERGDGNRIVALYPFFSPQLESNGGITADFRNPAVKGEQLFRCDEDFFLIEEPHRQARLAQHYQGPKPHILEPANECAGNSEPIRHSPPHRITPCVAWHLNFLPWQPTSKKPYR